MAEEERLSLRHVAEILDIERIRLYRLGRNFHFAPGDPCIPRAIVEQARAEADEEARYRLVMAWVLTQVRRGRSHESAD